MSNFTDFNALRAESDVVLQYIASPCALDDVDVVIIPGSKNTLSDLSYIREKGFVRTLEVHLHRRRELVGICGGYQMLGRHIADPHQVERGGMDRGLGYLDTETILEKTKCTTQVEACPTDTLVPDQSTVRGYQIHMGITVRMNERPCVRILRRIDPVGTDPSLAPIVEETCDGAIREDGLVWGTYIHGLFDEPGFRRAWLNRARVRKGLPLLDVHVSELVSSRLHDELDRWADHVSAHVDLSHLLTGTGLSRVR